MTKIAAGVIFLALNAYVYHFFASEEVIPPRRSFDEFPLELGDWRCRAPDSMAPEIHDLLGVTDYLACDFEREESHDAIYVYLGYHAIQVRRGAGDAARTIHTPKHCFPGSGWSIMDSQRVRLEFPGFPEGGAEVNRFVIAQGNQRQVAYYWYQSHGRIIAEDWQKVVALFWDRARFHRTDGSLVRFTFPVRQADARDIARGEAAFRDLASRIVPLLPAYMPE
jgi:EpsI family protein